MIVLRGRVLVNELVRRPSRRPADTDCATGCACDCADKLRRAREWQRDKRVRIRKTRDRSESDRVRHCARLRATEWGQQQCRCNCDRKNGGAHGKNSFPKNSRRLPNEQGKLQALACMEAAFSRVTLRCVFLFRSLCFSICPLSV